MIRARLLYIFIFIFAIVFALWNTSLFSLLLLIIIPLLLVLAALVNRLHKPKIECEFLSPQFFARNETIDFTFYLHNKAKISYRRVEAKLRIHNELTGEDEIIILTAPLYAEQSLSFALKLISRDCGKLTCHCEELRLYDFFAFTYRSISLGECGNTAVLPQVFPVNLIFQSSGSSDPDTEKYSVDKAGPDMSEIFEFRDYVHGDRLSQIQWKLSQKHGRLIVKEGSLPLESSVQIIVDPGSSAADAQAYSAMAEAAVSISQSLCEAHVRHYLAFPEAAGFSSYVVESEADLTALLPRLLSAGRDKNRDLLLNDYRDAEQRILLTVDDDVAAASASNGDTAILIGKDAASKEIIALKVEEVPLLLSELTV